VLVNRSFGKGLVQTVYPLNENTGLALTTAHFYTPSGRLIQRDYSHTSFYNYYYNRKDTDPKNNGDVKMTDSGRTVYGGGGITPDEKFQPPKYNKFQTEVLRKFALFSFTAKYFGGREAKLPSGWTPDQAIMNDFHQYLMKENLQFTEAEFAENQQWLKEQLRREMYITAFGVEDARKLTIESDPIVLKAVDSLPKAQALQENARKLIVQRTQQQKNNR
jgi:carboxyl-terminal processing protease